MKKYTVAMTAVLVTAGALLAGCSSDQTSSTASPSDSQGNKTLIFGRSGDSITLDPVNSTDSESNMVAEEVMDTLVTYKPGTSELAPDLATSWETSPDGLSWKFHLITGVKFQDGTPFNADAVVFNFQRWWDPSNPYHKGGAFSHFQSDLGGFKGPKSLIKDVKKVDDSTVEIDLAHPYAPLAAMLSQISFGINSPDNIKKNNGDVKEHPVGTGPFTLKSWAPDDKIVLQKNPTYRKAGLPKLDQLEFQVIKDNKARLNALQAGQIDAMEGLNPSDVTTVQGDQNLQLVKGSSNNVGYLAFNVQKKPFDNEKVRQAINLVIDKQGMIDAYMSGLAEPGNSLLPSANWAYDRSIAPTKVDIAKAKQLLAEAGFPNGFKTEIWTMPVARPYMPQPDKVGATLQAEMKQIGIDAKIVSYDWATYLKKTEDGEHTMCLLGWSASTWDPTTFMKTLLDSSNAVVPASNTAFYKNPQYDKLIDQALTVTDQSQRENFYKQAQEMINTEVPLVPLWHTVPTWVASKNVVGFQALDLSGAHFESTDISK